MLVVRALLLHAARAVAPADPRIVYEGRWLFEDGVATADWPCSSLRFGVVNASRFSVTWRGARTRLLATAFDASGAVLTEQELVGPSVELPFAAPQKDDVALPAGAARVALRKLTSATPYSAGVGKVLPSVVELHGLDVPGLAAAAPAPRRVDFVGASDTAGYCVDGTVNTSSVADKLLGWEYANCAYGYPGVLGRALGADVSVQALAGAGLTRNANAASPWQIGEATMAELSTRSLQTRNESWDGDAPDLAVVSLGGNDFNHQGGDVPSNETFAAAYAALLDRIFAVVTDHGDIGCDGHKNRAGQAEVARFLEPKLREIAGWPRRRARARASRDGDSARRALRERRMRESVQLVKRAPLRVAIATLWIDEPADDGRRLLPRAFRRAALARISAFLCAVRAATEMPVLVGTSNADVEAQRRICDPSRRVGVLNLTAVDTKAVFRPVYAVDEASTRKMWFNLTTNQAPQARTDGWKTRYKFILFNCTRWADQFVYLDLDVVLLADPHRVAKRWARVIVFRTDAAVSRALFSKSLTHDYLVYTNGDQDIMDAYWCPSISALPDTRRYAGCEIKARLDTSFALTYDGPAAPVFLSDPTMTGPAGVPHIHDAYAKRETCADYAVEIGVSRAPCQCLRSSAPSVAARRRLDAAFGYCLPFVREAYPGLTKPAAKPSPSALSRSTKRSNLSASESVVLKGQWCAPRWRTVP
ncbi:GDSL-like Lipase/Acylhydrolase [Aureococcus anophagefferens]|nr:GDSL-like Lipase/Acylhydrolase [Aureococcus anophagefferens]